MSELKILADRAADESPDADLQPQVSGVECKGGHLNDPSVNYCVVCGISMLQSPRRRVFGRRPQLGVLVFDNGMTVPVRQDLVLGRTPEADGTVHAGSASGVRLMDPLVDGVHARVELDEWRVRLVDLGSPTGTLYCGPGESSWTRVAPRSSVELEPGASAAFGRCVVTYYSHRDTSAQSTRFVA
ncbi:MAG TPA: FHA domain-containing protein [Pseudonocardiaceae bacterium]|jgi:hypothetical protein|nr:FHA domain-containing protein [Pseudonocardiaceae bacterium]